MMAHARHLWVLAGFALTLLFVDATHALAENELNRARKASEAASAEIENTLPYKPAPMVPDDAESTQKLLDESQRAIEAADREAVQAPAQGAAAEFPLEKIDRYAGLFANWTQVEKGCSEHFAISIKAGDGPIEMLASYRKTISAARKRNLSDPNARFCVEVEREFTRFAHRLHMASKALPSGNYYSYRVTAGPCRLSVGEMTQVTQQMLTLAKVGTAPLMSEAEFTQLQTELGYLSEGERVTVYQTLIHLAHDHPAHLAMIPGLAHRLIDRLRAEN